MFHGKGDIILTHIDLRGTTYLPEIKVHYFKGRLMQDCNPLAAMPRHLPCVEEVDPGLALLDLEQRAVVGGQSRLELLNHLDLQGRTNGTNIYRLAAMPACMQERKREWTAIRERAMLLRQRNCSAGQIGV